MLTVVLYGSSLALSSIGASLRAREALQVVTVDPAESDPVRQLHVIHPDVVVFDVTSARPDALTLQDTDPDLLVIGLDVGSNVAVVLSGTFASVRTTKDLVDVIFSHKPLQRSH